MMKVPISLATEKADVKIHGGMTDQQRASAATAPTSKTVPTKLVDGRSNRRVSEVTAMRGRIVSYMPHDRSFVIRPDGSTACDILCSEDDVPLGSWGLEVEFSLVQSDRGL